MTSLGNTFFMSSSANAEELAGGDFGGLRSVLTRDETGAPFVVFDTFDQEIRSSNRLLIESGGQIELFTRRGPVLVQPASRDARFVADFGDGPVKDALADVSPLRSLMALGSGEMRRGTLALLDDEDKTHARAQMRLLSVPGGGAAAVVTLQGLRGYDKALDLLRKRIAESGGTPVGTSDPYGSLLADHVGYIAKPEIAIGADEAAFAAATGIIAAYIAVARANEPGIVADRDTEFLHDYRIALRKVRSVLSLFKGVYDADQTAELKAAFSKLMEPTGRLRDLDVYLLERESYYDLLPGALHAGLDRMFDLFASERKAEQRKLAHRLRSTAYEKDVAALGKLFAKQKKLKRGPNADIGAHDFASVLIWKRYRKICKVAGGIGPDTDDAEIHQLRIHCKKLRYLMEFFAPVFAEPAFRKLLKPLKKLQDTLGSFNDCSVQQVSLRDALSGLRGGHKSEEIEIAQAVGALISVLHRKRLEERSRVLESFGQFNSKGTQAAFRALFHERRDAA